VTELRHGDKKNNKIPRTPCSSLLLKFEIFSIGTILVSSVKLCAMRKEKD
jgi:hypothetical protein